MENWYSWNRALSQLMNSSYEATPKRKLIIGSEKETPFPVSNCFEQVQEKAQGRAFALLFLFYFFFKLKTAGMSQNFFQISLFLRFLLPSSFFLSFHPKLTDFKYYLRMYYLKLITLL